MNGPIWPEIEFFYGLMPVLVTSKFDEDPIKNERASLETPFSHYKYMGCLDTQGTYSEGSGPIWPKFDQQNLGQNPSIRSQIIDTESQTDYTKTNGQGDYEAQTV